jgi:hypothetical protein
MLHIMQQAAGIKLPGQDFPLDLTQPKLRQTCDSFVDQTDLRPSCDSNIELESTAPVRVKQTTNELSRRTPHPFSIEALLGDTESATRSAPAQVYNYHSNTCCLATEKQAASPQVREVLRISYWCHACNSLCKDENDSQRHQYLHYMQDMKCNLKKELFHKNGYVTKHINIDEKQIECSLCDDKIVATCFFSKHQRLHEGHFCDTCDREFTSNSLLLDHMNIHTGSTSFYCKTCDRKFAKRSSLTQHQRYHRDNQRFKCAYCYKSFNSKYTRTVHERLHTGEKPFKCQEPGCMKAFPQKIQLQLHMNTHMN